MDNQQSQSSKSSAIPACPRCDFNKAQFQKTMTNYQKAYRKKVEGLKTELKTSRATIGRLAKQVRGLKSITRVHVPSLVVGALVGIGLLKLFGLIRKMKKNSTIEVADPVEAELEEAGKEEEEEPEAAS